MSYINNKLLDNIVVVLTLVLIIGYLSKKKYETIIFFIVISFILFFLFKNITSALIISILLTNLFISLNYFNFKEGLENREIDKNEDIDKEEDEDNEREYNNEYFTMNVTFEQLDKHLNKKIVQNNITNNEYILGKVEDMIKNKDK